MKERIRINRRPVPVRNLQAKLVVGQKGDDYEQEAEHIADQVMRVPGTPGSGLQASTNRPSGHDFSKVNVQAAGESAEPGFEKRLNLAGATPLPESARAFMEPRFGANFSGVRLHVGSKAAQLNREVGAKAFTRGQDIYLGEGNTDVESTAGRHLLAHELTHTIQQSGADVVQRAPTAAPAPATADAAKADDMDALIRKGDWHGAAWSLAKQDPAVIAARVTSMSSANRQALEEGARHGEGIWNTEAVTEAIYKVSPRDAIIGSVRFCVWKHLWGRAGMYMCGLNDADIRNMAITLRLTIRDMQVICDEQTDKAQAQRLALVMFTPEVVKQAPRDLIGKGGEKIVEGWLLTDPLTGPYVEKKFKTGFKITGHLQIVPADKWTETYLKHNEGRNDPELGKPLSKEEMRTRSAITMGFFDSSDGNLYVRKGEENPALVIHEAIHSIAPDDFKALYGFSVNEGVTEYFARQVARRASVHPGTNYNEEYLGVAALARLVGEATLAKAFFEGNAPTVRNAVDGMKGPGTFSRWVDAMQDDKQRGTAPTLL